MLTRLVRIIERMRQRCEPPMTYTYRIEFVHRSKRYCVMATSSESLNDAIRRAVRTAKEYGYGEIGESQGE